MNILFIQDETYLKYIIDAVQPCDDKTVVIIGERGGSVFPLKPFGIGELELPKNVVINKHNTTRKPWRERPKY